MLEGETEEAVPYHSPFWDTEKFVANLARFVGMTLEGTAGFLVAPAKEDVLFAAVLGEGAAFALDAARWADTAYYNASEKHDDKKLFQPW